METLTPVLTSDKVQTCAGVSVSLIGWPSNLKRICLMDKPWKENNNPNYISAHQRYTKRTMLHGVCRPQNDWSSSWCLTCLSQYAFISLLRGVCLLILNWTTDPSWPATFKLMWSFSVFTPSWNKNMQSVKYRDKGKFNNKHKRCCFNQTEVSKPHTHTHTRGVICAQATLSFTCSRCIKHYMFL